MTLTVACVRVSQGDQAEDRYRERLRSVSEREQHLAENTKKWQAELRTSEELVSTLNRRLDDALLQLEVACCIQRVCALPVVT